MSSNCCGNQIIELQKRCNTLNDQLTMRTQSAESIEARSKGLVVFVSPGAFDQLIEERMQIHERSPWYGCDELDPKWKEYAGERGFQIASMRVFPHEELKGIQSKLIIVDWSERAPGVVHLWPPNAQTPRGFALQKLSAIEEWYESMEEREAIQAEPATCEYQPKCTECGERWIH